MNTQEAILRYVGRGNRGLVAIVDAVAREPNGPEQMDEVLAHLLALLAQGKLQFVSFCEEDWMRSRVAVRNSGA